MFDFYADEMARGDTDTVVRDETEWDTALVDPSVETFQVRDDRLDWLQDRIGKLARKAARRGLEAIGVTVHGVRQQVWASGKVNVWHIVSVQGEAPAQGGYVFVATLEHLGADGTIVRTVPNAPIADGELAPYRDAAPRCDHCGLVRNRIDTYIVKHFGSGQLKQVGTNCLGDFLGSVDPKSLAARAEYMADVRGLCDSEDGFDGVGISDNFTTESFLHAVYAAIKTVGWVSRTTAREDYSKQATADLVLHEPVPSCKASYPREECASCAILHSDTFKAHRASALCESQVTEALEWVSSFEGRDSLSDYEHNLFVACRGGVMTRRQSGLVASVLVAYAKHCEREIERQHRAAAPKGTAYIGTVGKREVFTLTCVGQREIEGNYGLTTVLSFRDSAHNLVVWFASGEFDDLLGSTVTLKGTVKAHQDYNGEPQTVLTRCKIEAVAQAA